MLQDLRHGIRVLLQSKGWTVVVVLSLALGIGANTALFTAINGLLLRNVPVSHPETLVRLRWAGKNDMATSMSEYGFSTQEAGGVDVRATFSNRLYEQFRAGNTTLTDILACAPVGNLNVIVNNEAELASGVIVSGNYFRILGVAPILGRAIAPDDDQPSAAPVAMISHGFWMRRFGGDRNAVGKVVQVNNAGITIIGVTPPGFTGIQQAVSTAPDITVPLALDTQLNGVPAAPVIQRSAVESLKPRLSDPTWWWLQLMGRLKPGVTPEQVRGNLEGVFQQTARQGFDSYLAGLKAEDRSASRNQNRNQVPELRVDSGSRGIYDVNSNDTKSIAILTAVVFLVLLIVCANVANLLLSRATTRQKEISVRLSMGATRMRLIRQLLTESLLLSFLGGAIGILAGHWGKQLLPGPAARTPMDWRIVAFVVALAFLTGITFGIAPAFRTTRLNVSAALKENSRSVAGSRSILSKSLLVLQVAISLVLLIGAGLFLGTVRNLRHVNVGFNTQNLLIFRVNPQLNRYDQPRIMSLYEQMMERLGAVPGVRGATLSQPALLAGGVTITSFYIQGRPDPGRQSGGINRLVVASNFFETMEIPLLFGRTFTVRDNQTGPKAAVINEAAAHKYFPNENPIGLRFGSQLEKNSEIEIVGVVRDAKYNSVREAAPATLYVPYLQNRVGGVAFEVRTAGDPSKSIGAIREAVKQVDSNVPLVGMSTQMEQIDNRFAQERIFAQAYGLFGGLALLVASIGLFGLMSYSVARRTNEIGVRMALGAGRWDVVRMVMRESLLLVFIGVVIGLGAALAAGRLVATLLFGLAPTDWVTITAASAVMIAVSALAGYLPARSASRVDPMVALRYE